MFDTKLNDTMEVGLPIAETMNLCRRTVADLGWRVLEQGEMRIRAKEVAVTGMSFNWPAEVEIILSSKDAAHTTIYLNGTVFGFGPIQKGHLQGQMGNLRNRIELALLDRAKQSSGQVGNSLAAELEKLASLHSQGILTEKEFQAAKQRLLRDGA